MFVLHIKYLFLSGFTLGDFEILDRIRREEICILMVELSILILQLINYNIISYTLFIGGPWEGLGGGA